MSEDGVGFVSRWSRRKAQVRGGNAAVPAAQGGVPAEKAPAEKVQTGFVQPPIVPATPASMEAPLVPVEPGAAAAVQPDDAPERDPPPTMADIAGLTRESDYSRFVSAGVDEDVKRAAMKKLFSDPHFNVMDGLDTYIDDYSQPDPIPLAMLRQMNQSKFLRLFEDDEEEQKEPPATAAVEAEPAPTAIAAAAPEPANPLDDDPDLRLQQDDAAGRPGPAKGTGA